MSCWCRSARKSFAGSSTDFLVVQIKFYFSGIRVNPYRNFAVYFHFVVWIPCSYQMKGICIVVPLAAVEIVIIFGETSCFYNTEITAVWYRAASLVSGIGFIPWGRFSNVVKTSPDTFSGNEIIA